MKPIRSQPVPPILPSVSRQDWWVDKIISGGQTGVDRAALDVALALGIEHGGWCPLGRTAEDGVIPSHYRLSESDSPNYVVRTKRNILDSDGTLILYCNPLEGGTLLTWNYALKCRKPCMKVRVTHPVSNERLKNWITQNSIHTLNIAGPRISKEPMIYQRAYDFLIAFFGDV
jgi:hypothetical protein